ncbi:MAG: Trp biosynthesis-associated membrane protein [Labedaea sp.]
MPDRRPLWIITVALPLAAAALWGSSRLVWATELHRQAGTGAATAVDRTGAEVAPLVPLALLALAGVAAVVAVRGWPRRLVGVLLGLAGLTAAGLAVFTGGSAGFPPWGRGLAMFAGLLLVFGGGLTVLASTTLPTLGAGYQVRGGARRSNDGGDSDDGGGDTDTDSHPDSDTDDTDNGGGSGNYADADLWRSLSDGEDPTTR